MRLLETLRISSFMIVAAQVVAGCSTQGALDEGGTAIKIAAFTDEEAMEQLGPGWRHVEPGVFERHGDRGRTSRVAVGRRGLGATLARLRSELAVLEASGDPSAAPGREELLGSLRTRVADLESLSAREQSQVVETSRCIGSEDYFYALSSLDQDASGASAEVSAGRLGDSSPPVSSESYAYAGVFSGSWPARSKQDYGNSDTPASVLIVTGNFYQCSLYASAWVAPACSEAYLYLEESISCDP